jgi:copper chaperone
MGYQEMTFEVPGVSCEHCREAITVEVEKVTGVARVDVDLERKVVTVGGEGVDGDAIRSAIDEAGYDVAES